MRSTLGLLLLILAVPASAQAQEKSPYRLGPEDVVRIQVWGRDDLTAHATLDFEGNLRLPLLGAVNADNRTLMELGSELTSRYRLHDVAVSEVFVSIVEYNSRSITLVGEVRNPQRYGFRNIPGLWEAILGAGGPTATADLSHVQIVRKPSEAGESVSFTVDLSAGPGKANPDSLPTLQPKDTIVVRSVVGETVTGATIRVLGLVRTPGVYRLDAAETVVKALAVAGGHLPDADLRKVRLSRTTPTGTVAYHLDLKGRLYEGAPEVDFALKADDTISVPSGGSWFLSFVSQYVPIVTAVTGVVIAVAAISR